MNQLAYVKSFYHSGLTLEYCLSNPFNPVCNDGEVIVMQSAQYGRMRLGQCVDENFGYLGCWADVLSEMDQQCSGKQSCEVSIIGIKAQTNCSMPKSLSKYLEAAYVCKRGLLKTKF